MKKKIISLLSVLVFGITPILSFTGCGSDAEATDTLVVLNYGKYKYDIAYGSYYIRYHMINGRPIHFKLVEQHLKRQNAAYKQECILFSEPPMSPERIQY